ncbi:MAG: hypothetical protein JXR78_04840 [Victivallales bacterium]|nr:hypothetical protein [Victivallales bacterium]
MRTKYMFSAVIIGGIVLLGAFQMTRANITPPNVTPTFTTSRYMMFGGNYNVLSESKGEAVAENGVFKMDSYTGKVWILRVRQHADGKRTEIWEAVGAVEPVKGLQPSQANIDNNR